MTVHRSQPPKRQSAKSRPEAYTLVTRSPDGHLQYERFNDAASYRARLMALQGSRAESVSIDDVLSLLDA